MPIVPEPLMNVHSDPPTPAPIPLVVRHVLPERREIVAPNTGPTRWSTLGASGARPALAGMIAATALTLLALSFGGSSAPAATRLEPPDAPAEVVAESQTPDPVPDIVPPPPSHTSARPIRPVEPVDAVVSVLRRARSHACAGAYLPLGLLPSGQGDVELAIDIQKGVVVDVTVVRDTTSGSTTQDCLMRGVRESRFSADVDVHGLQLGWNVTRKDGVLEVLPVPSYGGY